MKEAGFNETPDYVQFKTRVFQKTGIDLNLYKQQQMHRRLLNMVERAKARDFMEYYDVIERNPQEFAAFLDRMTINVSELFRNPEKWREIRAQILPPLLAQKRGLKIWSAGCSYGAEPYSLAILLDQVAPGVQHTIHASDLDQKILAKAREGLFNDADVKNLDDATRTRYFTRLPARNATPVPDAGPTFQVKPEIRARVAFRPHNLLADRFESGYDLICCRNVVIYFTDEAKDRLYTQFYESLTPGGVLFVGGTERIFNFREIGFDSPLPFFYRRVR
jgi:chemotaxis protein methyltransferase CheR